MIKGACLIGQSGGPTAAINATISGLFQEALNNPSVTNVFGALNGVSGILSYNIIDIRQENDAELSLLKTTPSAALGSVRYKLPDYTKDASDYQKIHQIFKELDIRYFFYVGGNDSMDTCRKIADYLQEVNYPCSVIGVPKTIDNDLVLTDHAPGYGSAIKYIATTITELKHDISCYPKGKVTIVEIMGRDAGWLTCGAKLAARTGYGPDLIYLPEITFNLPFFLEDVQKIYDEKKHVLVVVSEGIKGPNGKYFLSYREFNNNDDFGHIQLGGVAQLLAEIVSRRLHLPVRSIELNIPQRCASHLLSKTDIDESFEIGRFALQQAVSGQNNMMVTLKRLNHPYRVTFDTIPLEQVANHVKRVPLDWITPRGNNVTDDYIDYALPLIKGEVNVPFHGGLPRYAKLNKIKIEKVQ